MKSDDKTLNALGKVLNLSLSMIKLNHSEGDGVYERKKFNQQLQGLGPRWVKGKYIRTLLSTTTASHFHSGFRGGLQLHLHLKPIKLPLLTVMNQQ